MLEAAHRLRTSGHVFQIKIIGEGPDREALEKRAQELQINDCIHFLGDVPNEQLKESLTDAAALVFPS